MNFRDLFVPLNAQIILIITKANFSLIMPRIKKLTTWSKSNKVVKFHVAYVMEVISDMHNNRKLNITT